KPYTARGTAYKLVRRKTNDPTSGKRTTTQPARYHTGSPIVTYGTCNRKINILNFNNWGAQPYCTVYGNVCHKHNTTAVNITQALRCNAGTIARIKA
ncbi:hypothetical protein, partial [Anaplasma marginale]|uniref:hypothetical protein n=1 Tax=Anaplasma marginale TaxID=770 RepID=UPI001CDAC41D